MLALRCYLIQFEKKAHYGNLITCGSVWTCPVCSARISEQRRQKLKLAMTNWRKQVGSVYLLTLTNPHYCGDNLKQLLEGQKKALKYLWCDRKPKEMLNKLGKEGHIIATEVTYGDNGFTHTITFCYLCVIRSI